MTPLLLVSRYWSDARLSSIRQHHQISERPPKPGIASMLPPSCTFSQRQRRCISSTDASWEPACRCGSIVESSQAPVIGASLGIHGYCNSRPCVAVINHPLSVRRPLASFSCRRNICKLTGQPRVHSKEQARKAAPSPRSRICRMPPTGWPLSVTFQYLRASASVSQARL